MKVLSTLILFLCPLSSWQDLSPQANVSISPVRADSSFHLLSTADNQNRMAVVPPLQIRQLKHKVERPRVSPSQGLNLAPSLPRFPRSQGSGDESADLAVLPSMRQLCTLGHAWTLVWRELLLTGGGKGWQEQQDPSADIPRARRDVSPWRVSVSSSHHQRKTPPQLCNLFSFYSLVKSAPPPSSFQPQG